MGELFSVVQFFANDTYEEVMHDVPVADAIACANHLATSVGAKIGTTQRVIITDADDYPGWEWQYGKGLVFPVTHPVPPHLQARGPHEFDCTECGRHVVDFAGPVSDPARCAACIHVPNWYDHPVAARILDPDHHRKR